MPPLHVLLLAAPLLLLLLAAPTAAADDDVVPLRHQRHQHAAAPKKRRSHGAARPPAPLLLAAAPLEPMAKSNAGAPNLENKLLAYESVDSGGGADNETASEPRRSATGRKTFDVVTRFLRIVETQHLLGDNCTAGTDLNLGEGVVDRYNCFFGFLRMRNKNENKR